MSTFFKRLLGNVKETEQGMKQIVIDAPASIDVIAEFNRAVSLLETNTSEAIAIMEKLAEDGYVDAMTRLAEFNLSGRYVPQNNDKFFYWTQKAANLNSPVDCHNLGYAYKDGVGVAPDFETAFKWYKKGAELGRGVSQDYIGSLYFSGDRVPVDYNESYKWTSLAAEQGIVGALYRMALFYYQGYGVVQVDIPKAINYAKEAANQNDADSFNLVGILYNSQAMANPQEAIKWNQMAADRNDINGMFNLATMYEEGSAGVKNEQLAVQYFEKAYGMGHIDAGMRLAIMLINGRGTTRNPQRALDIFLKIAEGESVGAMFNAALMYERGDGIPANIEFAVQWYRKAANMGYQPAIDALSRLGR